MYSKLLFRRQFILSSENFTGFEGWNQITLGNGLTLSAHPDLGITEAQHDKTKLILLGYMLDPFSPEKSDQDILVELVTSIKDFDDLVKKSEKYSGRWAIIYQDATHVNIFHDPCGQRQVYYYFRNSNITCGSTTAIINHFFHPEKDSSEELTQFIQSEEFAQREQIWIGDETIFIGVKHLMPNFYLDLLRKKVVRCWPVEPLGTLELNKGVTIGAEIIRGTILAANKRKKLALAVTSGVDSRVLLAASRDIREHITYYVSIYGSEKRFADDFDIPNRLLKKLGVPFYGQKLTDHIPDDFKEIYKKNITMARTNIAKSTFIYQQLLDFQDRLIVNGNAGEIPRSKPSHRPLPLKRLTANNLADWYIGYPKNAYVIKNIEAWLREIEPYCTKNNLNIYDMVHWEQKMGNWGALYPAEQDIAVDQLTPFNNRLFLSLMLSVDVKYRTFPDYTVFRKMIELLWPELLSEPVHPLTLKASVRTWGKHLLVKHISGY